MHILDVVFIHVPQTWSVVFHGKYKLAPSLRFISILSSDSYASLVPIHIIHMAEFRDCTSIFSYVLLPIYLLAYERSIYIHSLCRCDLGAQLVSPIKFFWVKLVIFNNIFSWSLVRWWSISCLFFFSFFLFLIGVDSLSYCSVDTPPYSLEQEYRLTPCFLFRKGSRILSFSLGVVVVLSWILSDVCGLWQRLFIMRVPPWQFFGCCSWQVVRSPCSCVASW